MTSAIINIYVGGILEIFAIFMPILLIIHIIQVMILRK